MNHVYFYGAAYRDQLFGPERAQRMDPAGECVRLGLPFTIHAAGQIGMADELGTLEAGKLADFTILEKDPYAVAPDAIMAIKVSETWVGGRKMLG